MKVDESWRAGQIDRIENTQDRLEADIFRLTAQNAELLAALEGLMAVYEWTYETEKHDLEPEAMESTEAAWRIADAAIAKAKEVASVGDPARCDSGVERHAPATPQTEETP